MLGFPSLPMGSGSMHLLATNRLCVYSVKYNDSNARFGATFRPVQLLDSNPNSVVCSVNQAQLKV